VQKRVQSIGRQFCAALNLRGFVHPKLLLPHFLVHFSIMNMESLSSAAGWLTAVPINHWAYYVVVTAAAVLLSLVLLIVAVLLFRAFRYNLLKGSIAHVPSVTDPSWVPYIKLFMPRGRVCQRCACHRCC